MRAERAERRHLHAHIRRRSRVAAQRDGGAPAPAGQRHDQPADSGTGAARRGGARPGAPREAAGCWASSSSNPERRQDLLREARSEEHTSELQSLAYLVCRLLLEKKKKNKY